MLEYFTLASLVTLLTHGYFALRLLPTSKRPRVVRAALIANCLLLPGSMVLTLRAPAWAASVSVPLAHAAFFDVGFCLLLFMALATSDIVYGSALAAAALSRLLRRARAPRQAVDGTSRREALRRGLNLAALSAAGGLSVVGYGVALASPIVRRVRVPVDAARVPAGWPALRIVQISDLHVGPTIRRGYVETITEMVRSLEADMVVITGDLVDGFVDQLKDALEPLRSLRARHGVYFVTGNHEYYYRANEWILALRSLGMKVLSNEHEVITHEGAQVLIAGIDDPMADRSRGEAREGLLARALAGAPERALSILLAHRPSDADHAAAKGFDLQLSGHLHGGQFFPLTLLLRYGEKYFAGLHRAQGMWLYVNQGAGYWGPPNRLGARQEIAVIELGAA